MSNRSLNRADAVKNLRDDMLASIKRYNGYTIEPLDVLIKLPSPEEVTQYPIIGIYLKSDSYYADSLGEDGIKIMTFVVLGYTDDILDAYHLSEDVEKFLYSDDNRHADKIEMLPEGVTFSTGGVINNMGVSMFDFEFNLIYTVEY
jgi:hypothetical protein